MMDAVKYLKEKERMCDSYNNMCDGCGFGKIPKCNRTEEDNPEKAVAIVEKWSAEHPIKTRQSEFLKMFPNAPLRENGSIAICPLDVDRDAKCSQKQGARCPDCQKEYWITEVGDEQ